jgi:hypothetical protein
MHGVPLTSVAGLGACLAETKVMLFNIDFASNSSCKAAERFTPKSLQASCPLHTSEN